MSGLMSKLTSGRTLGSVSLGVGAAYLIWKLTKGDKPVRTGTGSGGADGKGGEKKESRTLRAAVVDRKFFTKLKSLLNIAIPSWYCEETGYLSILLVFLIGRTFLSIKISEVNGSIVKAIVERNFIQFLSRLGVLASIAVPASTINSMLKYLGNTAALCFRKRLVRHFHDLYLQPMMYYRVLNLDNRISNPDQALTETMEKWGKSLSDLYSNVTKPLFDIILFSRKLSELVGIQGPLSVLLYYFISGFVIKLISPSFGKLTAEAQRLEGQFRYCHNRLITHSEEIAFYGGHVREKNIINENFSLICAHMEIFYRKLFYQGIFDGFLVKYGAVMLGYAVLGLPVFGPNSEEYAAKVGDDAAMITHDYIRNSSLLINLARAIGRIVTSYKELQKLAGYTALVAELQDVLSDLSTGKYRRRMVKGDKQLDDNLKPGLGTVISNSEDIVFEKVPIVTPNGDLLAPDVSFHINQKQNLMIVGPNGCGKSSLFRILGELWPLWGGTLRKPAFKDLFYIPQKPYLAIGTLRQQIIYPDSIKEMTEKKITDQDLFELLASVKLQELVEKRRVSGAGWDSVEDWADVLSGGEKQRVAMARLFYHKPKYAILDECTSAVSVDVEKFMYIHCRKLGISLITISHRPSLWKHHEWILKFDGRGRVDFEKMVLPANDVP